jgi:eukaryotic-like serine/threonine-protein kinase
MANDRPTPPPGAPPESAKTVDDLIDDESWIGIARPTTASRYVPGDLIGKGGMGEVRQVADRQLKRSVVRKELKSGLGARAVHRFIQEAEITAQLQHPGIVPVHELGWLEDGRPFYIMRRVEGITLGSAIDEVHEASYGGEWRRSPNGWSLHRLIEAFRMAVDTMAYAHDQDVVHRDLKPDNIMLGRFGQVLVIDWGLAKRLAAGLTPQGVPRRATKAPSKSSGSRGVVGTPGFMSPEQASGQQDLVDARSDVYALGAVLYSILCGHTPYDPSGRPRDVELRTKLPIPEPLAALCRRSMSDTRSQRLVDAGALGRELVAWLDGFKRREQAERLVGWAQALGPAARRARREAEVLREQGNALLAGLPAWAPEQEKIVAWRMLDGAAHHDRDAARQELEAMQLLQGALTHAPNLPAAHLALAERYRAEHTAAERANHPEAILRSEQLFRSHTAQLPANHPTRIDHDRYLAGDGVLTLHTQPTGARVRLYRFEEQNRRQVEVPMGELGHTPLQDVSIPHGSYLLFLEHPEHEPTRYPVSVERCGRWDGRMPGAHQPSPVVLPVQGSLEGDCYIPAGWFQAGGDATDAVSRRRLWADGFVIQRFPVTNRAYIAFLDDLVHQDREEEALRHAPRERGKSPEDPGSLIYGRSPQGGFLLSPDADGDTWLQDYPVLMVDWWGAEAFAGWLASRTGLPWRLPDEFEFEKAARGVDGRVYPWGNHGETSWARLRGGYPGPPLPDVVDSYPMDVSVYGVRGLGGNARTWCGTPWRPDAQLPPNGRVPTRWPIEAEGRIYRGGSWFSTLNFARSAARLWNNKSYRNSLLGIRLVRSSPPAR